MWAGSLTVAKGVARLNGGCGWETLGQRGYRICRINSVRTSTKHGEVISVRGARYAYV